MRAASVRALAPRGRGPLRARDGAPPAPRLGTTAGRRRSRRSAGGGPPRRRRRSGGRPGGAARRRAPRRRARRLPLRGRAPGARTCRCARSGSRWTPATSSAPGRVLESRLEGGRLVPHELGAADSSSGPSATASRWRRSGSRSRGPRSRSWSSWSRTATARPSRSRGASQSSRRCRGSSSRAPTARRSPRRAGDAELGAPRYDLEAVRPELARAAAGPRPRRAARARLGAAPARRARSRRSPRPATPRSRARRSTPAAFRVARDRRRRRARARRRPARRGGARREPGPRRRPARGARRAAGPLPRRVARRAARRAARRLCPLARRRPRRGPGRRCVPSRFAFGAAPPARALVLETTARVFTRTVRVYVDGADDPCADPRAGRGTGAWSHADPARAAPPLTLALPALRGERLLVALDDGDNAPLPLSSATLLLPAWRLRFFHPGPELQLLQGASGLAAAALRPRPPRAAAARRAGARGGARSGARAPLARSPARGPRSGPCSGPRWSGCWRSSRGSSARRSPRAGAGGHPPRSRGCPCSGHLAARAGPTAVPTPGRAASAASLRAGLSARTRRVDGCRRFVHTANLSGTAFRRDPRAIGIAP